MRDQFLQVARQDALRIFVGIMRLSAEAVGAKVGHDHAETRRGDACRMAELDPVHLGVGEQPVEQDHRPPLAHFAPGQFDPVGRGPLVQRDLSHGCRKVAKVALLARESDFLASQAQEFCGAMQCGVHRRSDVSPNPILQLWRTDQ